MKTKINKFLLLSVVVLIIALFVPTTNNAPVLADSPVIGKMANDGTRIIITFWDPFAEIIGPDRSYQREGAELPLQEDALLEYNNLYVYFVFGGPVQKNISYTFYYYHRRFNATLKEYEYFLYANETRRIAALGMDYCVDEFTLPFHEEEEGIKVVYRNVEFFFDHKTSEAFRETVYTGYHFKIRTVWNFIEVFGICVCIGGGVAGYISRKTYYFQLHWLWAIMIPLLILNVYIIYAEWFHYMSWKEMFYTFPLWAIYFIFTFGSSIIFINIFNAVKGQKIYRCAIYDTVSVEVEQYNLHMDKDELRWIDTSPLASLIRLFSPKSRLDNSFQFGKFSERTETETFVVDAQEAKKTIEKMKAAGFRYQGKKDTPDGRVELTFGRSVEDFEQKSVVPKWHWSAKGDTQGLLKEFWCRKIRKTRSTMVKKPWILTIGGSLAIVNLILNFVLGKKEGVLNSALKVTMWITFMLIVMITFAYSSAPGAIQAEPLDPHIAFSLVDSQKILNKAEHDAKIIVNLQEKIIALENEMEVKTVEEAKKIARHFIREIRSILAWKTEQKKHDEEEEEE